MIGRLVGWMQLSIMSALCSIAGAPQTAFSSIEHFMLNEHIYEDRCRVLFDLNVTNAVYCLESRMAYTYVYNLAELGFAIGVLPALISSRYFGFSVTNLFCCMALAAGSIIITSRPEDRWLNDRMVYGYAFVAFAGPFAIVNALSIVAFLGNTKRLSSCLFLLLIAVLQLSPLLWTAFSWRFANSELTVSDLFRSLLSVPTVFMLITLVIMPSNVTPQDFDFKTFIKGLKPYFSYKTTGVCAELDGFYGDARLFESEVEPESRSSKGNICSKPFLASLLAYIFNSISMDSMYLGGEAKAIFHKELVLSAELTGWSPLVAFLVTPLVLILNVKRGLEEGINAAYASSILVTFGQFLSNRISWQATSMLVGSAQVALIWSTTSCVIKVVELRWSGISLAIFLCSSTMVKMGILPIIETATEFDTLSLRINPYICLIIAQLLSSLYAILVLKNESGEERRWILELEAEQAFS